MKTADEIKRIAAQVAGKHEGYRYIGLRVQNGAHGLNVGDEILHESNVWDDGEMLDETVGGICAVSAKEAAQHTLRFGSYPGSVVIVIGANAAEYGDDDGEIILKWSSGEYPVVLDIIK